MNGDIWCGEHSTVSIQNLTKKTKISPGYQDFIKMLMPALEGQSEDVIVEILTLAQLERRLKKKSDRKPNRKDPKYLIMTCFAGPVKAQYPLILNYLEEPSVQRLRMTIQRLSQQLNQEQSPMTRNNNSLDAKQISMLKYQNGTLKAKIKSLQKASRQNRGTENMLDRTNLSNQTNGQIEKLNQALQSKQKQIDGLKQQNDQLKRNKLKSQNLIIDLKQEISELKDGRVEERQNKQALALLEQKFQQMNKQTTVLVKKLQKSKQQTEKDAIKISELENQLQQMMRIHQNKRKTHYAANPLTSSRKSETSVKSYRSHQSNQSKQSYSKKLGIQPRKNLNTYLSKPSPSKPASPYKAQPNRKPLLNTSKRSVYDSDTQSSKMRRANNQRVSPYRQTGCNLSSSSKKSNRKVLTNNRNNNIIRGNMAQTGTLPNRQRSRSRSVKSIRKQNSPPAEFPTDTFSSSDDDRNITEALSKLKERKNKVRANKNQKDNQKEHGTMGPLEKKITNIAEMLRKAKSRDKV